MKETFYDVLSPEEGAKLKGERKRQFVAEMFDRIAFRYDLMNLLISFGQTTLWRKRAFASLRLPNEARILDVGCGTGWVVKYLKKRFPNAIIEGMDISSEMLAKARRNDPQTRYFWGDVTAIPVADSSCDLVTTIFTMRNFPELTKSLSEMTRVLKPGGKLVILDTFPSNEGLLPKINSFWLRRFVPLLASQISDKKAYAYIAESIENFVPYPKVCDELEKLGCKIIEVSHYSFGTATKITSQKS
ncbi:MAG: demethylmenaquinone methyltransferase [Myxococcota bacterium]